jgi:hypothetical protein
MKKIHWRPVREFPIYWVSSDGNVKSCRGKGCILRPANYEGYQRVALWDGKKNHTRSVHRLVALAFLRPVSGLNEVNHKDLVKSNNNISNLEWSNRQSNMDHFFSIGKRKHVKGERNGMAKLTDADVLEIRSMIGIRPYHETIKKYGIAHTHYYSIKNKITWKHLCSPTAKYSATTATE